MDFKKYVWKRRGEINRKLKGLLPKEKKTFLELLWKKQFGANKSWSKVDGSELHKMLKKDKYVKENIISEGGAYGHMAHPFDTDINLTFGQLKDIVNRALDGELDLTTENL